MHVRASHPLWHKDSGGSAERCGEFPHKACGRYESVARCLR